MSAVAPIPLPPQPSGRALFMAGVARACRPRHRLSVSQWADSHRRLTSKASSEPGEWRTSRVPFMREIMDALSVESPVRSVTLMKSGQVAGTEASLNWIGYVMDHAPAPMLVVVPTLDVRERWVKQRLDPMLVGTPRLAALFDARRRRDGSNSESIKDYPGGMLIVGGANSPASLASMPIKFVVNDEVSGFPWEVGKEGDPLELIRKRQQNFPRRKEFNISTPTIKGADRIEILFLAGDQRYYNVPCVHCGELMALKWANLRWVTNPINKRPTSAIYVCEHCGAEIEEHHKTDMLMEQGYGGSARWVPQNQSAEDRSYHINGLYAPIGLGLRWVEMARKWISAQGDNTKLKTFINLDLGEPWEDRSNAISHRILAERAEPYNLREIPLGCLKLTCGVDVQGDRLELLLLGHGRGRVTWIIDDLVIPGDPARDEVWDNLTAYLVKPLVNNFGRELRIEATAIDTGGHSTQSVYNYVRRACEYPQASRPRRLMAIKGASHPGKPILTGRPQHQDVNWRGRVIKNGVLLWMVGTDTAKSMLADRLKSDANYDAGARLVRFSNALPEDFYQQLTAEVFDPERNRWVKLRSRRNEDLDCFIYGTAAAYHPDVRVHAMTARDWTQLEHQLEPPNTAPAGPGQPPPVVAAPVKPAKPPAPGDNAGLGSDEWMIR